MFRSVGHRLRRSLAVLEATDAALNPNLAALQLSRTFDTIVPTVALNSTEPGVTSVSPIPVTATFSEPVIGFDVTDLIATGATIANFAGAGANYSFDLIPIPPNQLSEIN